MIIDVDFGRYTTLIKFYKKDLTTVDDIRRIASSFATSYCFDALSLGSKDFDDFIDSLKPRIKYGIMVGYDPHTDEPVVEWGKVAK